MVELLNNKFEIESEIVAEKTKYFILSSLKYKCSVKNIFLMDY